MGRYEYYDEDERLQTDMTHQPGISRRGFIKATAAPVGSLIRITTGVPTIVYLLSPSFRKAEDDAIVDLRPLDNYPIGIPTRFEFTQTKANGRERTATSYGLYVVRKK